MNKIERTLWFAVAVTFGNLGGTAYQKYVVPVQAKQPQKERAGSIRQVALDENGVDAEKKTFPLGRKIPDSIQACHTEAAARVLAKAILRRDDAVGVLAHKTGCFSGIVAITYKRLVSESKALDRVVRIYEGAVGSLTIFVILEDWVAESTGTGI